MMTAARHVPEIRFVTVCDVWDGESVKGAVTVRPKDGKRLEHTGIKVQFIGTIGAIAQPS